MRFLKEIYLLYIFFESVFYSFLFKIFKKSQTKISYKYIFVKIDALGDLFILLQSINSLEVPIDESLFIVNSAHKGVLESYLPDAVVYYIDKKSFYKSFFYRLLIFKDFTSICSDVLLNLNISRPDFVSDALSISIRSRVRRCSSCDGVNSLCYSTFLYDLFYHEITDLSEFCHELEKLNRLFCDFKKTSHSIPLNNDDNFKYVVFCFGAGAYGRTLEPRKLIDTIDLIHNALRCEVYFVGPDDNDNDINLMLKQVSSPIRNFIGKTSLLEYIDIIRKSILVISNESSGVHIANYFNVPSICFVGGGHFNRFYPYPQYRSSAKQLVIHNYISCYNCNWRCRYCNIKLQRPPCIEYISSNDIYSKIENFLLEGDL